MITKYSEEVINDVLNLIDANQLVELKIWRNNDDYTVQYLSLEEVSFNKVATANAEIMLNDVSTLNNIEKMQNFLKEFKIAYSENRVNSFNIIFSCYKQKKCKFSCNALFKSKALLADDEKKKNNNVIREILKELDDADENRIVPGLFIRTEGKNKKYTKATLKAVREIIESMQ
jgi:hypothetical protein